MDKEEIKIIKDFIEDFFSKMTFQLSFLDINPASFDLDDILNSPDNKKDKNEIINLVVRLREPQVLIGEKGQTLFEIQKIFRLILNKKIQKFFNVNLDINDYKKKKTDSLRRIAKETADSAILSGLEKSLFPMSAFERRIVHEELSDRSNIKTESRGAGEARYVVIIPK